MNPFRNLRRRFSRTALTTIGISLAIALTVIMFSIGEGIKGSVYTLLEERGIEIYVYGGGQSPILPGLEFENGREIAKSMRENNSAIRAASPVLTDFLYCSILPNVSERKMIKGISVTGDVPELRGEFKGIRILKGKLLETESDPFFANGSYSAMQPKNFTYEIAVNDVLAESLKVGLNDTIYLSVDSKLSNPIPFRVVGIYESSFESLDVMSAYIHLSELQYIVKGEEILKRPDPVNVIFIDLYDEGRADDVKEWINEHYSLKAYTYNEISSEVGEIFESYETFSIVIAVVTSIVAFLFTATVMVMAVKERTIEIATTRAIGFSRGSVFKSVILESLLICIFGFIIGIFIGLAGSELLDWYLVEVNQGLPRGFDFTIITPIVILEVTGLTVLIGIASGILPAYRAIKLNIAETMKSE